MTAVLAGSATPPPSETRGPGRPAAQVGLVTRVPAEPTERENALASITVPAPLVDEGVGLRAGPVPLPLVLRMPSLDVSAPVVGVGITAKDVMDAPVGAANDPVWQQAFWYRGSGVPGAPTTALIAAHANDSRGSAGPFAHIDRLKSGDPVIVHDTRTALDVRFAVTGSRTYSLEETADPAVLAEIYGAGPVAGTGPQPSSDGLSHLTLITCTGTFRNGTHDRRLVVRAVRTA